VLLTDKSSGPARRRDAREQIWREGVRNVEVVFGQRFPVPVKSRHSAALPRYSGFRRGITHYTWTSDQYSPYGTKVIPSTVRDATYVLDEILDNETELPIEEHTTDTAGYTELIFALFDCWARSSRHAFATWPINSSTVRTAAFATSTSSRCFRARSITT
jgi:TnpA family transposase